MTTDSPHLDFIDRREGRQPGPQDRLVIGTRHGRREIRVHQYLSDGPSLKVPDGRCYLGCRPHQAHWHDGFRPCYVGVHLHDLAFGGREEGGWWYDTQQREEQHYVITQARYHQVMESISRRYSNAGRPPISSVLSNGQYRVHITDDPQPTHEPRVRPHYE